MRRQLKVGLGLSVFLLIAAFGIKAWSNKKPQEWAPGYERSHAVSGLDSAEKEALAACGKKGGDPMKCERGDF